MRVKDSSGYLVVAKKYWNQYGMMAYVDRVCINLDEARYVRDSLERCDGMAFVIIKGGIKVD